MNYRLALKSELPQIADLRWRLQTDDADDADLRERADFIQTFSEDRFDHWVAEAEGRIVAVMSVFRVPKVPSPTSATTHWGYLTNCYTLPQYRNQGIGTQLLATLKAWALENGYEALLVFPSDKSYAFYQRAGFKRNPDPLVLDLNPGP